MHTKQYRTQYTSRAPITKITQAKHLYLEIPTDLQIVPDLNATHYDVHGMDVIKNRLNKSKSGLDPYYILAKTDRVEREKFTRFQSIIDLYRPLKNKILKETNAKIVTNAWMKYWEIYNQYFSESFNTSDKVIAFFNAELPGAALCAFNHYMKTKTTTEFDWFASSLAPGENDTKNLAEALGDTYGLYSQNKDHWLMTMPNETTTGRRNNGDVTNIDNLIDFAKRIGPESNIGGVHLYSHDAGIDVSDDFNNQESANARIHLGCALGGFMTLRKGGSFIAKQYTFFETLTWNLILIYAQLFDQFYICKPLTSRPHNSEIYLIGKGFRGLTDNIKELLSNKLQNFNMNPLIHSGQLHNINLQVSEIISFASLVYTQQSKIIDENIKQYEKYRDNLNVFASRVRILGNAKIAEWLKLYPVPRIRDEDQLKSFLNR